MTRSAGTTFAAPYASAPPVGAPGDTYFNTTSKILYLCDGTSWLQVQPGGVGLGPIIPGQTDFNNIQTTGLYSIAGNAAHGPGLGNGGVLTVVAYDSTYTTQTWQMADNVGVPQVWMRQRGGVNWTPWLRVGGTTQQTATFVYNPGSLSGGGTDVTAFNFTAAYTGVAEVTMGVFYFGFGGATVQNTVLMYTNSVTAADGAALQTPVASTVNANGAQWARSIGCSPLIFPVTAGNNYIVTLRAAYVPSTTNCYFWVPMALKVYAS